MTKIFYKLNLDFNMLLLYNVNKSKFDLYLNSSSVCYCQMCISKK